MAVFDPRIPDRRRLRIRFGRRAQSKQVPETVAGAGKNPDQKKKNYLHPGGGGPGAKVCGDAFFFFLPGLKTNCLLASGSFELKSGKAAPLSEKQWRHQIKSSLGQGPSEGLFG